MSTRYVTFTFWRHGEKDGDALTELGFQQMRDGFRCHLGDVKPEEIVEALATDKNRTAMGCATGLEELSLPLSVTRYAGLGYEWVDQIDLGPDVPGCIENYEALVDSLVTDEVLTIQRILDECPRARLIREALIMFMHRTAKRIVRERPDDDFLHVIGVNHGPGGELPGDPEHTVLEMGQAVRYTVLVTDGDTDEPTAQFVKAEYLDDDQPEDYYVYS